MATSPPLPQTPAPPPQPVQRRVRTVVYSEASGRGGAEVSVRNLLAALDPAIDVTVMGVDAEICRWLASARPGTPTVVVPRILNKASLPAFLATRRAIARLRPDVFHANLRTMSDARYALLAAISVPNVRVVAVEQLPLGTRWRPSQWLKRLASKRLAAHVAVGERTARLVEEASGLRPGSVATVYNGVPDCPPVSPKQPQGPRPRVVVGTLARLDRIKGLDLLLEALTGIPDVDVVIGGEGPDRDSLRLLADELGLGERVRFLPWSDDGRAALADMDVFVLPSRNEGFPLSIVEAMLAERPVVATDVGSVREAVVDGTTGYVVQPEDVEGLAAAIERLVRDADLRRRMGAAGRALARDRFTDATMARAFEEIYQRVTGIPVG